MADTPTKHQYLVLQLIWHTGHGKHYDPDAVVPMEHLDDEQIKTLIDRGVVRVATHDEITKAKRVAKEVTPTTPIS